MVGFVQYAIASAAVTGAAVYYAYSTRLQFYPTVIYLVTSKSCLMVVGNMALVMTLLLGQLTNKLFLGRLREVEKEIIWENLRYSFTETCLALSTFREEISLNVIVMFSLLLFIKVFHWLCEARIEHIEQSQDTSRLAHIRTVSLMVILFVADIACAGTSLYMVQTYGPSVQVFFGFEYVLLAIKVIEVFVKYCLSMIDSHLVQGQWYNKSLYELYLKLVIDIAQLFVNVVFFGIIFTYYGVPLHLMRQLYIALKNVHNRLSHFFRFRRITSNLHDRFPNATEADLEATDRTCIICREEMEAGDHLGAPKKLSCGHIFHFFCLRNWLERQLKCPTCRSDITTTPLPPNNPAPPPAHPHQQPALFQRQANPQQYPQRHNLQQPPNPPVVLQQAPNPFNTRPVPQQAPNPFNTRPVPQQQFGQLFPPFNGTPFPMGLPPTAGITGAPINSQSTLPSVTQYIQGQIDILQLQLQVYEAQVAAAKATEKAAEAALRIRKAHSTKRDSTADIMESDHAPKMDQLKQAEEDTTESTFLSTPEQMDQPKQEEEDSTESIFLSTPEQKDIQNRAGSAAVARAQRSAFNDDEGAYAQKADD